MKKLMMATIFAVFLAACGDATTEEKDTAVKPAEEVPETTEATEEKAAPVSMVVVDESDVKITYTGLAIKEDEFTGKEAAIQLEIENNSDQMITVQQRNLSVDGMMVDDTLISFSTDVTAGKKAKGSFSVLEFDGYDFPTFNESMEFDLVVLNGETYEDILVKPVAITIE